MNNDQIRIDNHLVTVGRATIDCLTKILCVKDGVLYQLVVDYHTKESLYWKKVPEASEAMQEYNCTEFKS